MCQVVPTVQPHSQVVCIRYHFRLLKNISQATFNKITNIYIYIILNMNNNINKRKRITVSSVRVREEWLR